jgi:type I restriction enzyme M protein
MDIVEAVIGLGSNIFYGTQLAACILVFRALKKKDKKNKVLFIDASDQVREGRAQNFLEKEHIERIYGWYRGFENVQDHTKVASLGDVEANDFNLNISLYVEKKVEDNLPTIKEALKSLKAAFDEAVRAEDKMKEQFKMFGLLK